MISSMLLVFIGGLLGSAHCVGMCGGFALSIGAISNSWRSNLARQAVYSIGRIATYSSAGAIAGYGGLQLSRALSEFLPIQAILALVAGVLLIAQGMFATGVLRRASSPRQHACLLPRFLGQFLRAPSWSDTFFAGVFTGFLPCGLVYAFLALASAKQNIFAGWLTMLAFGFGTTPVMVLTGVGGNLLTLSARDARFSWPAGAWCLPGRFPWFEA